MSNIKRTSSHILKFSNKNKLFLLDKLFADYKQLLQTYVNMLCDKELPLKALLSSNLLPDGDTIKHSQWKQIIYKQASEIVRGTIQAYKSQRYDSYKKVYKYFKEKNRMLAFLNKKFSELNLSERITTPICENISINIDERLVDFQHGNCFDEFIRIKLPYFCGDKKRAITINLPIKQHKHSLKYKNWIRKNTIQIVNKNGNYYLNLFYEKEYPSIKQTGISIGIDVGYKKLISTSQGKYYGIELNQVYTQISQCKRNSKHYKGLLKYRNNLQRKAVNDLDLTDIKTIFMEDLSGLKLNTFKKSNKKSNKNFRNKSQYALYTKVYELLQQKCEEQGVQIVKVSPKYTSQTCSRCKIIDKTNRQGEIYQCKSCGLIIDADYNAAINILNQGVYSPFDTTK